MTDKDAERPVRLPPAYRLVQLSAVDSTMDEARHLAEEGAEDGTLVWAREQTKGRGRQGRDWNSPTGNLYLSLVLRPECEPSEAVQLGFVTALAIGDAIGAVSPPVNVTYKWPNDVLLNHGKVAGILLETRSRADGGIDHLILGCGINLASAPIDTPYRATCLHNEGAGQVDEVEMLEAFGRHMLTWTSRWLDNGFAAVRSRWLQHAERKGERIEVRLPSEALSGVFEDIDTNGYLLLMLDDGTRRRISSGDVFPAG